MLTTEGVVIRQHLIDPEICIRCNTCEATCPVAAITHDSRNYVVNVDKCDLCMACIAPCPTGAIDNWRSRLRPQAYSVEAQLSWDELPVERDEGQSVVPASAAPSTHVDVAPLPATMTESSGDAENFDATHYGATVPPWSAAHPYVNLYGPKAAAKFIAATVAGNVRVTKAGHDYDTHHIVLDFGTLPFPVLEGQSIGVIAPGTDARGRPHHARQYSVASPRDGERPGYNNLALTVKRVLEDHQGRAVRGVCSNYLCDLRSGDQVRVIGPFGNHFLMPNHPGSSIVMICTGTGSAPMRAMTERRRRLRRSGELDGGKLMLFFGARTQEELPYFGPLQKLPKDFIDIHLAFSRTPGRPKCYVQDLMGQHAPELAVLLNDPNTYFYICGLKSMEAGVLLALRSAAQQAGLSWESISAALRSEGRLHMETY